MSANPTPEQLRRPVRSQCGTRRPIGGYLGPRHPVAKVARRRCRQVHPTFSGTALLGKTACARCWEQAIRDDERVVVLFDLPREQAPDPSFVDDIAVERACAGERVPLSQADRRAAVIRLWTTGLPVEQVALRLRMHPGAVARIVDALVAGVPEVAV